MQNRMNKKDIQALRNGLDLLLTDCKRYMKRHDQNVYESKCTAYPCRNIVSQQTPLKCPALTTEVLRLCALLNGVGLSERYQPKPKYPKTGKFKSGRSIVLSRQPAIPGDNDNER